MAAHCDARILHAPCECPYCDLYPHEQLAREGMRINFTGHTDPDKAPCPADEARPPGSPSDHRNWPGNRPEGYELPVQQPAQQPQQQPQQQQEPWPGYDDDAACWSHHRNEPTTRRTYIRCGECGHAYSAIGLWWAWVRTGRGVSRHRFLRRPRDVFFCQECIHDF